MSLRLNINHIHLTGDKSQRVKSYIKFDFLFEFCFTVCKLQRLFYNDSFIWMGLATHRENAEQADQVKILQAEFDQAHHFCEAEVIHWAFRNSILVHKMFISMKNFIKMTVFYTRISINYWWNCDSLSIKLLFCDINLSNAIRDLAWCYMVKTIQHFLQKC